MSSSPLPATKAEYTATLETQKESPQALFARLRAAGYFRQEKDTPDLSLCLTHLLETHNWDGNLLQLRDALPGHTAPMDMVDLLNTMACLGYNHSTHSQNILAMPREKLPALFIPHGKPGKLWIVTERTTLGWKARDALTGEEEVITDGRLSGIFYVFSPFPVAQNQAEQHARTKIGYTWFRTLLGRFGGLLGQILALSACINLLALAPSVYVMVVYNQVIGGNSLATLTRSVDALLLLALGTLIFLATETALRFIRLYALSWFGARLNAIVSAAVFRQLLSLPSIYTERVSVAAQIARIKAFESVRDFFTGPAFLVVLELPMLVVLIAFVAMLAGPMAFIPIGAIAVYGLIFAISYRSLTLLVLRSAHSAAERQQAAIEMAARLHVLKYNGVTGALLERFNRLSRQSTQDATRTNFAFSVVEHIAYAGTVLAGVATLTWGVYRIWAGELSVGALVVLMLLTWRILGPLQSACALLPRLHSVYQSIDQVNRLMRIKPEHEEQSLAPVTVPFKGAIQFAHVGLRYARRSDPVFLGLSFDVAPGELVAIAGGTGSGKSSLLKMACGLYAPQAGAIRFDEVDIRQYEPVSMRNGISYLPQQPDFFSGSIIDNLRLHTPDATEFAIKQALQRADAWDEIDAMPEGIHSEIGAGRLKLSTSLATKLNLARIYLAPRPILLLDELPYSLLNSETGKRFMEFLKQIKGTHTVLFATHRNDYIALAHKVLLLRRDNRPALTTPEQALSQQEKDTHGH